MDIKITINIGLTAGLETFLQGLIGGNARPTGTAGAPSAVRAPATSESAAPASDASTGESPSADLGSLLPDGAGSQEGENPTKRTRRTKAQIEADNAAAAQATTAPGDQASSEGQLTDLLAGSDTGQTATTDASPSDLEAAMASAEGGEVTWAQVEAAMSKAITMEGMSPKKLQERMIAELDGAKNRTTLKPELYPKALALFETILAGG